ncbi:UNVERIFIED_CONTAM: hypothetical protein RMT77_005417 [Armadillidium vulgare]
MGFIIFLFLSFSVYNAQYREEIIEGNLLVSQRRSLEQLPKTTPSTSTTTIKATTTIKSTTTIKTTRRKTTPTIKTTKRKTTPTTKKRPALIEKFDAFEFRNICSTSFQSRKIYKKVQRVEDRSLPKIYVITPTYGRPEMIPELTRLGQSLLLVPRLHWIIAEDSYNCTDTIIDLLNSLGSPYTYLLSPMPNGYRKKKGAKPKGVSNRRAALDWIKEHGNDADVLYFLDDDNTVNVKLFDEIRFTQRVSMFPVGFIGEYRVSSPIVKKDKVVGFYDSWIGGRKFAVDMGGFAVNVGFLREHMNATMPYRAGYEEDGFLKSLGISLNDIEPKAENCTKILVWHTKTTKNKPTSLNISKHIDDNIIGLVKNMKKLTVIK